MLDFNNTEIAFSAKSQSELKNAYLLFNTIKYPWLVKCASVVSNIALNIHFPLGWAVKPTLYKQFVGGETLQDCTKAIDHLRKFNVRSTLDFSAEGEQTPEGIQATFEETIRSIDFAKGNDNLAYAVFKPSTIITDELLAKVSEKQEELTIMEAERARAAALGYPDPICKDKQATDENFDEAVRFTMDHLDCFEMFMGTHNEESNYKLAKLIDEKGLKRDDPRIFFAQLLGMSDNISFNLAHEGYNVTKYVPYAKVRDVLPYLIRRAEENTSVAGQTSRELRMLKTELDRRKAVRAF